MSNFLSPADPIELLPQVLSGIVVQVITNGNPGRVRFRGSDWPAELYQVESQTVLLRNERVGIVGRQGITLLVRPLESIANV